MLIYGINPVLEALRARRVTALRVAIARRRARHARSSRLAERAGRRRSGAWQPTSSIARRGGGVSPGSGRGGRRGREPSSVEDLIAGAAGRAADRRARRHRGSAQRRRDPADGRCGGRRRRRPAVAARGAARRRGGEGVGGRGGAREDCRGREHRAGARGAEGGGRLDGRAGGRRAEALRSKWISRCRRRWSSGRKGPGCGGWCGSGATGWSRSRCGATFRA